MDARGAAIAILLSLLVLLVIALAFCASPRASAQPVEAAAGADACGPPVADGWQPDRSTPVRPGTIFVSVPSYRDDECKDTVWDMYDKADRPEAIFAGVVQQNKYEEEDCFDKCPDCKRRKDSGHIRVKNYDFSEARGPCFARYQASKLWSGEEYFMEIDSHTRFVRGWDSILMEQLRACGDPKAIIAGYPPTAGQLADIQKDNFRSFPMMCNVKFNEDGLPQVTAQIVPAPADGRPVPIAFAGANLMVMPHQALFDAPFDPHLSFLFFGEELLHSARLWTAGYNFYAPVKVFASHHYGRNGKPKFWDDLKQFAGCRKKAVSRVKAILGMLPEDKVDPAFRADLQRYGLGAARPIEDYWTLLKVDVRKKKARNGCTPGSYKIKNLS